MSDTAAERLTVPKFMALKKAGRKITMLTAYDYTMAQLLDETGVDALLVGDSMSMVVQGHSTTLPDPPIPWNRGWWLFAYPGLPIR